MAGYASKRIQDDPSLRILSPAQETDGKYLAEIASPLRLPTVEEKTKLETEKTLGKCQVCFSVKCPSGGIGGHDFTMCGRFCPNCNRPLHLHCAGLWSQKSGVGPNLFRCPACYTLLKLPPSIQKGLSIKEARKSKTPPSINVKMIRHKGEGNEHSLEVCGFCYQPLVDPSTTPVPDADRKLFQCNQCGAIYHADCLEKMYKVNKSCQNCNGIIGA